MRIRVAEKQFERLLRDLAAISAEPPGEHLADNELTDYVLEELSPEELQRLDEHLASCAKCTEEVNQIVEVFEQSHIGSSESRRSALRGEVETLLSAPNQDGQNLRLVGSESWEKWESKAEGWRNEAGELNRASHRDLVTAIEIGSTAVRVLVGRILSRSRKRFEVLGRGSALHNGARRGEILKTENVTSAIRHAVAEAEAKAEVKISQAYIGIAGSNIRSSNRRKWIRVEYPTRGATRWEVRRLLKLASAEPPPPSYELLHAFPQDFKVDRHCGIRNPIGVPGTRLEVNVHQICVESQQIECVRQAVKSAGVEPLLLIFQPLATAEAVLNSTEIETGVILIDVGGGTTEYAFFSEGEVQVSGVRPVGGAQFTNDLALLLRMPFVEAERVKIEQGKHLGSKMRAADEIITIPCLGGRKARPISRRELVDILLPRIEEVLMEVRSDLEDLHGIEKAWEAGVVLTGGQAYLGGFQESAERVFKSPVRLGWPAGLGKADKVAGQALSWCAAYGAFLLGVACEIDKDKALGLGGRRARGFLAGLKNILANLEAIGVRSGKA